ncbi:MULTISPECIES: hypothetical protein [unclassified Endozoicomonas]|nr:MULTISPECIES: hypothetical protein [unclassified Endozoicomonas]
MTYANDSLNVVAVLFAQTLLQVMFPYLTEEEQVNLQASSSAAVFRSAAGGENILQQLVDKPEWVVRVDSLLEVLEITVARVQSLIDSGDLVLQAVYSYEETVALQRVLNSKTAIILESGISTYPQHEQPGIRRQMAERVNDFMTFLRSKMDME